jgi:hypothetical protein
MCIICVKPKNKAIPAVELLTECFKNNPHGAGLMYPSNGQIRVLKGLMDISSVLNALNEIPDSKSVPIVIHFRFATHGDKSAENTHPFPLSGDFNDLIKLDTEVYRAIVHNGIMYQYGSKTARLSDSAFFAKLLSGLQSDKAIKRAIEAHRNFGKFVVMSADDKNGAKLLRVGDFVKSAGCFWSNGGFKPPVCYYEPVKPLKSDEETDIESLFFEKYPETEDKYAKLRRLDDEIVNARDIQLKLSNGHVKESDSAREARFRAYMELQRTNGAQT